MSRPSWLLAIAFALCAGCGKSQTPAAAPAESAPASTTAAPQETAAPATTASTDRDSRTKWIGDVPYDVFYDRPLEVYGEDAPSVGTAEPANSPTTTTVPPEVTSPEATAASSPETTTPAATSSTVDWATVAPMDRLEAETKEIRTRLSANLQTVATFNANVDGIETDGSVLAMIAAIIERHPEDLNWKDRARYVRQLAYDIYTKATGKGRGPFQSTKEPFEKIVGILDGGPPPEIDAPEQIPLAEAGDRSQAMLRFESGFNWLRSDINTPTRMQEEKDRVLRETTVLAALATALGDPSFDGADQEQYRTLLQQFISGQQSMTAAAEQGDFAGFEKARDTVQKSCDACHLEYRNSSSE